jgi:hypothetical protein
MLFYPDLLREIFQKELATDVISGTLLVEDSNLCIKNELDEMSHLSKMWNL